MKETVSGPVLEASVYMQQPQYSASCPWVIMRLFCFASESQTVPKSHFLLSFFLLVMTQELSVP